jgi:hypothetical protein
LPSDVLAIAAVTDAVAEEARPAEKIDVSSTLDVHVRMLLFIGLALAVLVRLALILSSTFPLNDGGMFDVMIRDLQQAHYALPHFTTYNGMHIPYAYPPLAFYVSAFLADVTQSSPIEMLRLLPLLLNLAAIGAFALLARSILRSRDAVAVAVVAFCFLPHSVLWQVMGGGLTRGFGFLFALLALQQAYELFAKRVFWRVTPTAVFAALTVLSHPKMAWFLAYSLALFVLWHGRTRRGLLSALIVFAATVGLTAPWWLSVVAYHGVAPFLASARTGSVPWGELLGDALRVNISGEPFFPLIGLIALVGIIWSIRSRQWFLVVWLAIMMPLDSREYLTDTLVPVSLFVGIGFVEVLNPLLDRLGRRRVSGWQAWLRPLGTLCVLGFLSLGLLVSASSLDSPLPAQERAAMAWVAQNTPSTSQFLVITGESWYIDRSGEWFPDLAGRESVATVQGSEWLSNKPFAEHVAQYNDVQECTDQPTSCLDTWSQQTGTRFDYVYVSKTAPSGSSQGSNKNVTGSAHHFALEYSLKSDSAYTLVFENEGAAIFKRN